MALVFRRGGGDCPSGCTENEYWYFQSDAVCKMQVAGHYHPQWMSGGASCLTEDGAAKWALPPAADPSVVCGADNSPQNISGIYMATATGKQVDCGDGNSQPKSVSWDLSFTINQTPGMLGEGTVVVDGTGNKRLDGVPLKATFVRRRVSVEEMTNNNLGACQDQSKVQILVDLADPSKGTLRFDEVRSVSCPEPINTIGYCKGYIDLSLELRQ